MNGHDDDYEGENGHDHENEHEHDHEVEEAIEEALELDTQSQIFLEMRQQNLDLLRIASEVAGFHGPHPALRPNELKGALKTIWEVYSEFYAWIDPEESDDDDDDDDEDDL
jgi:hypothetical protein